MFFFAGDMTLTKRLTAAPLKLARGVTSPQVVAGSLTTRRSETRGGSPGRVRERL
jgi:hypothetical protein